MKLIKKGKPVVEAGQRIRPEAQSDDVFVVLGVTVSKHGRKTSIEVLLVKEDEPADIRALDYNLMCRFADQPDRFLDAPLKSFSEATLGRHLLSVMASGKGPLLSISETAALGKVSPALKRVSFSLEAPFSQSFQKRATVPKSRQKTGSGGKLKKSQPPRQSDRASRAGNMQQNCQPPFDSVEAPSQIQQKY